MSEEKHKEILERLAKLGGKGEYPVLSGKCKSVDEAKAQMTVAVNISGQTLEIEEVMLNALDGEKNGIVIIPEVDSDVVICSVDGTGEYMLVKAHKVDKIFGKCKKADIEATEEIKIKCDKIIVNDGSNGGVPILDRIKANHDAIKNHLSTLSTNIAAALTAVGVGVAANGPAASASFSSANAGNVITFQDMEDTKFKH